METASDAELVARAAAGQADSMGELFDRHAGRMKSLALRAHGKGLELAYHVAPDVAETVAQIVARTGAAGDDAPIEDVARAEAKSFSRNRI